MKRKFLKQLSAVAVAALFLNVVTAAEAPIKASGPKLIDPDVIGEEHAVLTKAPKVPPPITRKHPTKIIVNLEVQEVTKRLADGVDYVFWTFGGDVPGSFIRIREGDQVEFHLNNHQDSKMPHNIDLHAVTGPGGGAASSFTAPGHSSQFSFKALNPGLYVYHCATAPVGLHVGNGMYGLILVEPKEGLPPVDREYYIMQGDFYTVGKYGEEGLQPFDMNKAIDERPTYVLFNGAVGSLTGDKAITAKVGERVRLFVGNGGPNLVSSFHVIGEIFDNVYQEGGVVASQKQVQTTMIPAGGSAVVDFKVEVPGTYILVDHSLFRAFNKGAIGMLKVEGAENQVVYSGKEVDAVYLGKAATSGDSEKRVAALKAEVAAEIKGNPKIASLTKEIQMEKGKGVYMQTCFVCHQMNGEGIVAQIPPLAKSDYLAKLSAAEAIELVLAGRTGEMTVNGKKYNGTMTPLNYLSDDQIANVLTYVRNSFGNEGTTVSAEDVKRVRATIVTPTANQFE